jgi:hypothetical protein
MRTIPDPRNPAVVKWLDGIQPAWTMLDWDGFLALQLPPSPGRGAIRLAADLTQAEIQQSAVARNAVILLRAAAAGAGLKLTATKNLSRAVVLEMIDRTVWPGFDNDFHFGYHKVINEPEFYPLFFLRNLLEEAKMLRRYKGHLRTTRMGSKAMEQPGVQALLALLFFTSCWRLDLGYFSHCLHDDWPQCHIGSILWSLSIAAHEWQTGERLTRLCAPPIADLFERPWDTGAHAMEGQILRPLRWFGLLEARDAEKQPDEYVARRLWRKTALFDRFLSFDIQLPTRNAPPH